MASVGVYSEYCREFKWNDVINVTITINLQIIMFKLRSKLSLSFLAIQFTIITPGPLYMPVKYITFQYISQELHILFPETQKRYKLML